MQGTATSDTKTLLSSIRNRSVNVATRRIMPLDFCNSQKSNERSARETRFISHQTVSQTEELLETNQHNYLHSVITTQNEEVFIYVEQS